MLPPCRDVWCLKFYYLHKETIGPGFIGSLSNSREWIKNEVRRNPLFFGACIFAFGAAPVGAQDQENSRSRLLGVESSFLITNGLGEFGDLTGVGFGFTMGSTWMPKRNSGFGVRLDLSLNLYDRESTPTCLTDPCWIEGDVVTNYGAFQFGIGPEWTVTSGPVQPYIFATVGRSVFYTSLGLELCGRGGHDHHHSSDSCYSEATENYHTDWGPVVRGGGGLRFKIWKFFGLYLGAVYQHVGTRTYMVKGDLDLNDDGSVTIGKKRYSAANNLGFEFGLHWDIPGG